VRDSRIRPGVLRLLRLALRSDRRARADADAELDAFIESRVEHLVTHGAAPDNARARAIASLGAPIHEVRSRLRSSAVHREARMWKRERFDGLIRDVKYAGRSLRRTPSFTFAATAMLALTIGATASVFGVVDAVLLKPFPFSEADRTLLIMESNSRLHLPKFAVPPRTFLDWRAQSRSFSALAASRSGFATVIGSQEPERVIALLVTPSYFPTLGITPVLGRALSADSSGPAEVVISYAYWQTRFGGAPSVLGKVLAVDDRPYCIVGVVPNGWPGEEQLWTRLSFTAEDELDGGHNLVAYGRLRPGATADEGRRELDAIVARGVATTSDPGWSVVTKPLLDQWIGDVRPALIALLAGAGCVLLIGATTLANLYLVRCFAREREIAVRMALGATRVRLTRELLVEATLLSLTAAAIGVGVAVAGVRVLRALAPSSLPRVSDVAVDGRMLGFCALATVLTVLVFGALPAWKTSRAALADFLREGGRGTGEVQQRRLQDGLVILQLSVAFVLLTGAGLLMKSLIHLEGIDLGFRPQGVLTAMITLSPERYPTVSRQTAFALQVVEHLASQPGVTAASVSTGWPGRGVGLYPFSVVGGSPPTQDRPSLARVTFVSRDYFRTMGIALQRGREILPSDDRRAVPIVVIDDDFARRFFAGRDPIGRRLVLGTDSVTVVGVVASVREEGAAEQNLVGVYEPVTQAQDVPSFLTIASRVDDDPRAHADALRRVVTSLDATVPISDVKTMTTRENDSICTVRFSTFLASLFALAALVLGAVGIYSVLAYIVRQRRREIGIRIALGARNIDVMSDILKRTFVLTVVGLALGTGAAWMLTRTLASLFVGVSPHDPGIFATAAGLFALVALLAASVPAFRTTRINAVVALNST
jgi:putative ABC transport system permease protein